MASAIASRLLPSTLALLAFALPAVALAEPTAADKATAQALFEHGKQLMREGHYFEACPKLAESQRLDAGIGTLLYLADCYEKAGQTASAWAQFLEAAAAARAAGQGDREKKARDRAAALEGHLNKVVITLAPGADHPGVEVRRDGAVIPRPLLGTPLPIDPGEHKLTASAPGKKTWSLAFTLPRSDAPPPQSFVIPALEDGPPGEAPVAPLSPSGDPGQGPSRRMDPGPPPAPQKTSPVRAAGFALVGVGVAGAAAGGILGGLALAKNSDSSAHCRANDVCDSQGADDRHAALGLARGSTIALIAGGGVFVTGLVMLLASPAKGDERQVLMASPTIAKGGGGLSIAGSF